MIERVVLINLVNTLELVQMLSYGNVFLLLLDTFSCMNVEIDEVDVLIMTLNVCFPKNICFISYKQLLQEC